MNKKDLSSLILILLLFTLINFFLLNSAQKKREESKTISENAVTQPVSIQTENKLFPEETKTLETSLFEVTFSNLGGRIKHLLLKNHFQADGKSKVDLVPEEPALSFWIKDKEYLANSPFKIDIDPKNLSVLCTYKDKLEEITKKFTFSEKSYLFDLDISVKSDGTQAFISWGPGIDEKKVSAGHLYSDNEGLVYKEGYFSRIRNKQFSLKDANWAGLGNRYFLIAFLPQNVLPEIIFDKKEQNKLTATIKLPFQANQHNKYSFQIYAGPKNYEILKSLNKGLEKTIDLGWKIIEPFSLSALFLLKAGYKIVHNYGLVIIILTILIKLIFHPLSIKSFESSKKLQKIQPEMKKIQEKFKNQPDKLQKEITELYKREKLNPFSGCLPVLIQIPIFIALFSTLSNSIELRGSGFLLWIKDLSRPDTIFLFGKIPINILPILMGISMFIQQKMMPAAQENEISKQMLFIMPVFLTVLFWSFPSGLVLYWLTNNIISIFEQYFYIKKIN